MILVWYHVLFVGVLLALIGYILLVLRRRGILGAEREIKGQTKKLELATEQLKTEGEQRLEVDQVNVTLTKAIENTDQGIAIINLDGIVKYVNPAALKMGGYKLEELIGKHLLRVKFISGDEEKFKEMWSMVSKGAKWSGGLKFLAKDGRTVHGGGSVTPVRDLKGRVSSYVAIWRDITEDESREKYLQHSQKMEAVGRLAGGIAHDFNNILSVIMGHCEMVMEKKGREDGTRENLSEIIASVERAAGLTRQLLTFSRKQEQTPQVISLNETINSMNKMLKRLIGEDIQIRASLQKDGWNIRADPSQIEQVLLNLLLNAREAMPKGGNVTIESQNLLLDETFCKTHPSLKPGAYFMLAVSDTGVGMDKETLAHIFEPFFSTKPHGTGMGLATVYGIIQQSGGFISVYSEPGLGTTFKIYLPRVIEKVDSATTKETSAPAELPRGNETILMVEDEQSVKDMMSVVLRNLGYTVYSSGDPVEALLIAKRLPEAIHLLITDMVLPKMSGSDLANQVTSIRPAIKILFMSGYSVNHTQFPGRKMLDLGEEFLQKPFTIQSLAKKIREILDQSKIAIISPTIHARKAA